MGKKREGMKISFFFLSFLPSFLLFWGKGVGQTSRNRPRSIPALCLGTKNNYCIVIILIQAGSLGPRSHCQMLAPVSPTPKSKLFLSPHTWEQAGSVPHTQLPQKHVSHPRTGDREPFPCSPTLCRSPCSLITPRLSSSSPGWPLRDPSISVSFSASKV